MSHQKSSDRKRVENAARAHSMSVAARCCGFVVNLLCVLRSGALGQEILLEPRLKGEAVAVLAQAALRDGDAARGAVVFHQAQTTCAKCHAVDGSRGGIGPELTALPRETTDVHLVESLLDPSKAIRQGFELVTILTIDGRSLSGIVIENNDSQITLRDPATLDKTTTIPRGEIEQQATSKTSAMPTGLANQCASRQQFLDLVRYLMELRDGGRARAAALMPPPSLLALQLPEYESRVDHAGLIRGFNQAAFQRGKAIYERLCVNCHGTHEQPGSLPTSLRFATGKFKSGHDPLTMYQTLTRGFGLMAPQTWMVPRQKYDVIHYIREAYLQPNNPSQYFEISPDYLAGLPTGDTRGPAPRVIEPWATMDYGPSLIGTFEVGADGSNIAQKGIAVRLDAGTGGIARGSAWTIFEHDTLRWAGSWTGKAFIDWNGINFNGKHQAHPHVIGDVLLRNPTGPGWADPSTGSLADEQRVGGRDGKKYGPLPRAWGKYRGLYHHGDQIVVSYTVGSTDVLESPGLIELSNAARTPIFTRTMQFGPRERDLITVVASAKASNTRLEQLDGAVQFSSSNADEPTILAGLVRPTSDCTWTAIENHLCLKIPAGKQPLRLVLWTALDGVGQSIGAVKQAVGGITADRNLSQLTRGGPPHWPQKLTTRAVRGAANGPLSVDILTHPDPNPWLAQMRFTGLDFLPGGHAAVVCAWDGDVWLVSGLTHLDDAAAEPELTWQRIASGLFQPLGIKFASGQIFVTCRDQLVKLHDLNGDGETDFYECFNSDHQVTEHFHEFAMGLQTDEQGNFYYAKSARHALPAVVPQHGTLLKVSADGSRTDILANGFRAANGVLLNDDGTFVVTDQEGHWNPKNRINWVTPGKFYGNMFGYHDVTDPSDDAMEQPLCWITNAFDRSPGELLWVPAGSWGPLAGKLLNLSYGTGKLFVVPFEEVERQKQGGMCMLPVGPLPTGVMRGRFHPVDRQLFCCGMFAWAGSATQPGGLYRIRYTGQPLYMPIGLTASHGKLELTFTDPLARAVASDPANFRIKTWSLKRSAKYGSDHYNEQPLTVERVHISTDGRTATLHVPNLQPTWGMEIACRLIGKDGQPRERVIDNSIFQLNDRR